MLYIDGKRVKGPLRVSKARPIISTNRALCRPAGSSWTTAGGILTKTAKWSTGWLQIGNVWYYLDPETGLMYNDGLAAIGKSTYYFYDWGGMASDWWYEAEDGWYFFGGSGAMKAAQWLEWKGDWYYLTESGKMAADTEIGGYYVNAGRRLGTLKRSLPVQGGTGMKKGRGTLLCLFCVWIKRGKTASEGSPARNGRGAGEERVLEV